MDDDVAGTDGSSAVIVEAEAVGADVTGDDRYAVLNLFPEGVFAPVLEHSTECVVAKDLAAGPLRRVGAFAGANQQNEGAIGHSSQDSLHQGRAQKPSCTGDGYSFTA